MKTPTWLSVLQIMKWMGPFMKNLVACWILLITVWLPAFSDSYIPERDGLEVAKSLNHAALIPVAANSPGRCVAHFKTRVVIFNPTSREYSVAARVFDQNGPAGRSLTIPINPGQYLARDNLLQEVLSYSGSGAVIFSAPDERDTFYLTAEVYTNSPNGRCSTTVVNGIIPRFVRSDDPDANIGIFNIANEPSSIEAKVFDTSGTMVETIRFEPTRRQLKARSNCARRIAR